MDISKNKAVLSGTITHDPEFSHRVKGQNLYETFISVKRASGIEDIIPIVIAGNLKYFDLLRKGERLKVTGSYLSHWKMGADGKKHMFCYLLVKSVEESMAGSEDENKILLCGYLAAEPIYRRTPMSAKEITDIIVASNRKHHKSAYIPVIVWHENAAYASRLKKGDPVEIAGMITSRKYEKQLEDRRETRTAYEVSAYYIGAGEDILYEQ